MIQEQEVCKYWQLYEKGLDYIRKKRLIDKTNRNWNFFSGRQWEGIQTGGEELPFQNFIKPTIKHKVSTVSQNNMVAHYSDAEGNEDLNEVYAMLDQKFSACWEHANMDMILWSTIKDAAVTGDGLLYFGTENMNDVQRLQNTSVLYGDESQMDIQKQPYVIIHQRMLLGSVRDMARENGIPEDDVRRIQPDSETQQLVGNRDEVTEASDAENSKVTVLYYFTKVDGVVHVAKCTKNVIIEPIAPICAHNADGTPGAALTMYPIVKYSWEDFPNDARGLSEVEQLIPNQLEYNKTQARWSMIIKLCAYPRMAYLADAIANPEELEKVGKPIAVNSAGMQSINQMIQYLNPASTNGDPRNYSEDLMRYSQELSGSGETAMGNINPNRVAASAIIAIRDQAALPLNEQVAKMKTFVEEYARLAIEIWMVTHPDGMDVLVTRTDPETGEEVKILQSITKEDWDRMVPDIRIDTSQDSPWTKEAEQNLLDLLLDKQHITFEEYVELSTEHGIVPKNKLKKILEKRKMLEQQMAMQQQAAEEQAQQEEIANDPAAYAQSQWEAQELEEAEQ